MSDDKNAEPSRWRRVLVISGYLILASMAYSGLTNLVVSSACSGGHNCHSLDMQLMFALNVAESISWGWIAARGWAGRLFGCRRKAKQLEQDLSMSSASCKNEKSVVSYWAGNFALFIGGLIPAVLLSYARCTSADMQVGVFAWMFAPECLHGSALDGFGALFLPIIISSYVFFKHGNVRKAAKFFFWWAIASCFAGMFSNS